MKDGRKTKPMDGSQSDILVINGQVVFPDKGEIKECPLSISNGKIVSLEATEKPASKVIDASGCIVSPGFIDIHMHNEEKEDPYTVQGALLKQGVTTALAGNCGAGLFIDEYKAMMKKPYLNLGLLTGHNSLRKAVGISDVYKKADNQEIAKMCEFLEKELQKGSFGLSLGLEYVPNASKEEITRLSEVLTGFKHRIVSVHIRHDGPACIEAVQEMIDLAKSTGLRVELSHLGSMTAFGMSRKVLEMLDRARSAGIDIRFDTYPYAAFCTYIGSTVFDRGFEKRWKKGFEALEVASGPYKGQTFDEELYERLRSEAPQTLIIAHVLNEEEIRACMLHPMAAIGSDAVLHKKGGHPRAAGAFPRGIGMLREEGLSWPEALAHATSIPGESLWLESGCIEEGKTADLVIFDPEEFRDEATFENPLLPPQGVKWVIVNGKIAVENGRASDFPCGEFLLRTD
jgi:N-acyl-D-amino-acid deacylase